MDDGPVALSALLSAARRPYGAAIRERLAAAGYDDVPARGPFVLGSVRRGAFSTTGSAAAMGVSKQALSGLVDALVTRGYLAREPDPADRRRLLLTLTERGAAAAEEVRLATAQVDGALEAAVGADAVATTREALLALAALAPPGTRDGR